MYEVDGYIVLSKHEFLAQFGRFLNEEQYDEFLGGYYDGDTMHLWSLGIEVGVEANEVVFRREDYQKALKIIKGEKGVDSRDA